MTQKEEEPEEEGPENVWDKTGYETKSEIVIVTVST